MTLLHAGTGSDGARLAAGALWVLAFGREIDRSALREPGGLARLAAVWANGAMSPAARWGLTSQDLFQLLVALEPATAEQ